MENENKKSLLGLDQIQNIAKEVVGYMTPLMIKEPTKSNIEAPELLKIQPTSVSASVSEQFKPVEPSNKVVPVTTNIQVDKKFEEMVSPETLKIESPQKAQMPEVQLVAENNSTTKNIEQKTKEISDIENKMEQMSSKNISMKTIEMLKPAFDNVEKALKFTASLNQKRDFDDSHYTVPTTQSLFNLTANQISNFPAWRK